MVTAALLAFVLVMAVLGDRSAKVTVAVAAHDIAPGATIGTGEVRLVEIPADSPLVGALVTAEALAGGDKVASRRVAAGAVLSRSDLAKGVEASSRSMSIPVSPEHAVGGQLGAGDLVDVIDGSVAPAQYVLRQAEVLAVASRSATRGLAQVRSEYYVTITVDPDSALRLAAAIAAGKLELVRASGAIGSTS